MSAPPLPCVVLAGGTPRPGQPLWEACGGRPKAVLEIAGRPMVAWVLDALAAARSIGPVVLVGLDDGVPLAYSKGLQRVAGTGSLVGNLYAGIDRIRARYPGAERAAYCWSDIPLARGEAIDRFAGAAAPLDADVVAGLVRRERLEGAFPGVDERWLRLVEGRFVAADFGLLRPAAAAPARRHLEALAPRRKSALAQARQVGLGLLARYLVGRLSIAYLERRIERAYGLRARVLEAEDPELGLDVDGPVNLAICRQRLRQH